SNHGTTNPLAPPAGQLGCPACSEQAAGSTFLQTLNAGDETPGQVSYTVVTTRYDEVVVPYTSAFLAPGPLTVNLVVQDYCPADPVGVIAVRDDGARRGQRGHRLGDRRVHAAVDETHLLLDRVAHGDPGADVLVVHFEDLQAVQRVERRGVREEALEFHGGRK